MSDLRLWGLPVVLDDRVPAWMGPVVVSDPAPRTRIVDPLVAELKPTARFLEELQRLIDEATTPRYVRNAYVPVDLVVQISGDPRLFYNPRDRHGYPSRLERALHPTPGYTRNMLGAREAARDWRLHR